MRAPLIAHLFIQSCRHRYLLGGQRAEPLRPNFAVLRDSSLSSIQLRKCLKALGKAFFALTNEEQAAATNELLSAVQQRHIELGFCVEADGNCITIKTSDNAIDLQTFERLLSILSGGNNGYHLQIDYASKTALSVNFLRKYGQYITLLNFTNQFASNAIKSCNNLHTLAIRSTHIESSALEGLTKLATLREFYLDECGNLTSMALSQLSNLQILSLSANRALKAVTLGEFSNLRTLDLSHCSKLRTINLSALPRLEKLDLSYCGKVEAVDLSQLISLRKVDLSCCSALTCIDISEPSSLERIDLSYCRNLAAVSLCGLTNLQTLKLSWCENLTSLALPKLRKLQAIDFTYCSSLTTQACRSLFTALFEDNPAAAFRLCSHLMISSQAIASLFEREEMRQILLDHFPKLHNLVPREVLLLLAADVRFAIVSALQQLELQILHGISYDAIEQELWLLKEQYGVVQILKLIVEGFPAISAFLIRTRRQQLEEELQDAGLELENLPLKAQLLLLPLYSPEQIQRSISYCSSEERQKWLSETFTFQELSGTLPELLKMIKERYLDNLSSEEHSDFAFIFQEWSEMVLAKTIGALAYNPATVDLALTYLSFMALQQLTVAIPLLPTQRLISSLECKPLESHRELFSLMSGEQKKAYFSAIAMKSRPPKAYDDNENAEVSVQIEQFRHAPSAERFNSLFTRWAAHSARVRITLEGYLRILKAFDRSLDLFGHRGLFKHDPAIQLMAKEREIEEFQREIEKINLEIDKLGEMIQPKGELPADFFDPLTMMLMENPMRDRHGNFLDASTWHACGSNPYTRESLAQSQLSLDLELKARIDEHSSQFPPDRQ
jgi:hypothetical protein